MVKNDPDGISETGEPIYRGKKLRMDWRRRRYLDPVLVRRKYAASIIWGKGPQGGLYGSQDWGGWAFGKQWEVFNVLGRWAGKVGDETEKLGYLSPGPWSLSPWQGGIDGTVCWRPLMDSPWPQNSLPEFLSFPGCLWRGRGWGKDSEPSIISKCWGDPTIF